MNKLLVMLTFSIAFSAFAYDSRFFEGDIVHLRSTSDIHIPANVKEVRTSCGVLLEVEPKTRARTYKAGRNFSLSVTSATRFWTRLEVIEGTTIFHKAFLNAHSFNTTKKVLGDCSELALESIQAVEKSRSF